MSTRERLSEILERMQGRQIVVYGDLVADRFVYGVPKRISREAPVLILRQEREDLILGGGGNAVNNIRSLGGTPHPVSIIGDDGIGTQMIQTLNDLSISTSSVVRVDGYHTPTKTRVLAGMPHAARQQIVRLDREEELEVDDSTFSLVEANLRSAIAGADGVVISDYGYGSVRSELTPIVTSLSSSIPVTLDSRYDLLSYPGVTAASPNEEEAAAAAGRSLFGPDEDETLREVGGHLLSELRSQALLITRGSRGMALFETDAEPLLIPVHGTDQIADVTGAGDTVIATFTLALSAGASFTEAAKLANYAGSVVVMKMGTATVTREEILAVIQRDESLD